MTLIDEAFHQLTDGVLERAEELFSQVLLQDPADARAYRGRGFARLQLKAYRAAHQDFVQAHALDPEDLESWSGMAMSLAMDHEIYPAITVFEELLAKHPRYVKGYIQLASLYFRLCLIAKGRTQLETAMTCRPTAAERKLIEQMLTEQKQLDRNRYYRPDFEALQQKQP